MIQFPMMFLSGAFFQIDQMPAVPAGRRPAHPADLPRRRAAPGDGRRRGLRAAVGLCGRPARLAGRLLRDRRAQVPVAVGPAYQRSSRTISPSSTAAAGPWRAGEVGRVGRIAERQQELAVLVGRVGRAGGGPGRGRRRSPGTLPIPSSQATSIMFWAAWPRSNSDRQRRVGRSADPASPARSRRRRRRGGRPTARPPPAREVRAVATDDERPALLVLAAARVPAGVDDPVQVRRVQRPLREAADDSLRRDRVPDRIGCQIARDRAPGPLWHGPARLPVAGDGSRGGAVGSLPAGRPGRAS